jgi:uncharacterized protein involved in cysteine biosynthesis
MSLPNNPIKKTLSFFDKLEDRIRGQLSKFPIVYTLIGGVMIVLFWRAVWNIADNLEAQGGWIGWLFYEPTNLILVLLILLATGLFVSYFIGDTILISGLKHEKKITEQTEKDVVAEEAKLAELRSTLKEVKKEVEIIKDLVVEEHKQHHSTEHRVEHKA